MLEETRNFADQQRVNRIEFEGRKDWNLRWKYEVSFFHIITPVSNSPPLYSTYCSSFAPFLNWRKKIDQINFLKDKELKLI